MMETLTNPTNAAIAGAVILLGIARLHSSRRTWSPNLAWFWWPLRRYLWPVFDHALARVPGPFYAKTTTTEDEAIVGEPLDVTLDELHDDLTSAGYEAQPLASLARFERDSDRPIAGDVERSSLAKYRGSRVGESILPARLLEALPDWLLRRRQTHVRPYGEDGAIVPTAHAEYNPWNPLYAVHHLLGVRIDTEDGVIDARADLGLYDVCGPGETEYERFPERVPERVDDEVLEETYAEDVDAALEELRENLPTASKGETDPSQKTSESE